MPTFTPAIVAGAFNRSKTFNFSGADATRLLNGLRAFYGQVSDGLGGLRDRTDIETVDAWFADIMSTAQQRTQFQEKRAAQAASVDSIAAIGVS